MSQSMYSYPKLPEGGAKMEKEYHKFLKAKAEKAINDFFDESSESAILFPCREALINDLYKELSSVAADTLDKLFLFKVSEKGLIDDLVNADKGKSEKIVSLENEFSSDLLKNGDMMLKEASPTLYELLGTVNSQFFSALDEFITRFKADKVRIEDELFNGKKITIIKVLSLSAGDKHNHGRSTSIVETDIGKFVYRPRNMQIDVWMDRFFRKFFSEIAVLPKVIEKGTYGYCSFIENKPADTAEKAAAFFEKYGELCAVSVLLGSRDLHMENVLSDGEHPVPIDLEMMISPVEDNVKTGSGPKDLIWTNTILSSGFMPHRIGKFEIGALFSTDKDNLALPVIDGKKIAMPQFENEFISGFETAYRKMIEQRDEIAAFFDSIPDLPIRVLIRATQPYGVLRKKSYEFGWLNAENRKKDFTEVLALGFDKLGLKDRTRIFESERDAIFEANIPFFFTMSKGRDIYDCNSLVISGYYKYSCIENLHKILNEACESRLQLELDIIRQSAKRYLTEAEKAEKPAETPSDIPVDYNAVADKILIQLADHSIAMPENDYMWFYLTEKYDNPLSIMNIGLFNGLAGIAVFAAAESAFSRSADVRALAGNICTNLLSQINIKVDSLLKFETLYENILSGNLSDGLAGLLHANELIALYTGKPECSLLREKLLKALFKCDFSLAKTDFYKGCAGLIKVLCMYDNLSSADGVTALVDKLSAIVASRAAENKPEDKAADNAGFESVSRGSGLLYEDFLLSGNCAVVDRLLEDGIRTGDSSLIEEGRVIMAKIINRAQATGEFTYIRPEFRNFFEASLFRGAAGIGYECLRCIDPVRVKSALPQVL